MPLNRPRVVSHLVLAALSAAACGITTALRPDAGLAHVLTIGLGYVALGLGTVTLVVGPLWLLCQRRNPVNIDLRRDVGIWTGITGLAHVVFGLQIHLGGSFLLYFFERRRDGYRLLANLFGLSNWIGAIATVVLAGLLLLSNDISLRWLRGARWKFLQRFNYLLFLTVLAHTVGYQVLVQRHRAMVAITAGLTALALAAQLWGLMRHRRRQSAVTAR